MKLPSKNQPFTIRVKGDSMAPAIQDGDILLVDRRCPVKDKSIVVARIKDAIVCRHVQLVTLAYVIACACSRCNEHAIHHLQLWVVRGCTG